MLDYVKGMSLYTYLQRNQRLTVEEAFHITHILLQVIDEMNQKGFVHRDIKPANIIIEPSADENLKTGRVAAKK